MCYWIIHKILPRYTWNTKLTFNLGERFVCGTLQLPVKVQLTSIIGLIKLYTQIGTLIWTIERSSIACQWLLSSSSSFMLNLANSLQFCGCLDLCWLYTKRHNCTSESLVEMSQLTLGQIDGHDLELQCHSRLRDPKPYISNSGQELTTDLTWFWQLLHKREQPC